MYKTTKQNVYIYVWKFAFRLGKLIYSIFKYEQRASARVHVRVCVVCIIVYKGAIIIVECGFVNQFINSIL